MTIPYEEPLTPRSPAPRTLPEPLRRGEPEDIAAGVLYLASQAGQYVTGKLIEIDGGIQQPTLDLGLPDVE